jgi:hypothetical protein
MRATAWRFYLRKAQSITVKGVQMDSNYEWIRDNTLIRASAVIGLCNKLGHHMTHCNFVQQEQRGRGPKITIFEGDKYYRVADVRAWIERRLKMTIREAIRCGKLKIPADLPALRWDLDNQPVRRVS